MNSYDEVLKEFFRLINEAEDDESLIQTLRKFLRVVDFTFDNGCFIEFETLRFPGGDKLHFDNCIYIACAEPVDGVKLWFQSIKFNNYTSGNSSFPGVMDTPYSSRSDAVREAISYFRELIDKNSSTKREKKLGKDLLEWLVNVEVTSELNFPNEELVDQDDVNDNEELGISDEELEGDGGQSPVDGDEMGTDDDGEIPNSELHIPNCIDDGGQLRLAGGEDGFVRLEDVDNSIQIQKIKDELDNLKDEKKRLIRLQKAYGRRSLFLTINKMIETAKKKSELSHGTFFAADNLDAINVYSSDEMQCLDSDIKKSIIVYAMFADGREITAEEFGGVVN